MSINWQQLIRSIILFLFFLYIYRLHQTGDLLKLINPKYETLSMIGAILFLLLFIAQLFRIVSFQKHSDNHHHDHHHDHHDHHHHDHHDHHHHDHGDQPMNWKKGFNYLVIVGPLVTGFIFPLASLDASIARNKGATMILTNQQEDSNITEESTTNESAPSTPSTPPTPQQEAPVVDDNEIDPNVYKNTISKTEFDQLKTKLINQPHIEMDDVLFSTIYQEIMESPETFQEKEITMTGFVYREAGFQPNQLVMSRFLITHCIADAGLIGFLTEFNEEMTVEEDTWLTIRGKVSMTNYQGSQIPLIEVSDYEIVDAPAQQYVYPLTIQILGPNG
ncbi:TIGR03943 family protein [Gracilibacillus oryzae]|uniref:TIGR03943 family protein n=1 Tax=Gracilibacillus oryzae TaxID=1672701 RepID=A0A7C8L5K0_9BACI|nr:TIGR03943 family protein [Gracilibacillus oryzae]KAB8128318.1 TIGR03943 family protein [Gracilibacillus oryzae]